VIALDGRLLDSAIHPLDLPVSPRMVDFRQARTYERSMIYKEKLDWIAVRNCQVLKQGVGDFNTSDHHPIWTQIRL
jgi:hypothetical protein